MAKNKSKNNKPTTEHNSKVTPHHKSMKNSKPEHVEVIHNRERYFRKFASAAFTCIFLGCIYSESLWLGVPGGDAGELLAESCVNGVAHPPGYPLLVIATNHWLRICPFKTPADCANMLNSMFSIVAAIMVSWTVDEVELCRHEYIQATGTSCKPQRINVLLSALLSSSTGVVFGLTPLVWLYSVSYEVFALNNMTCAILVFLSVCITRKCVSRETEWLQFLAVTGAFVIGMGMSNQHTFVLFALPLTVLVFMQLKFKREMTVWMYFSLIFGGLLGLSPYIHVYISGQSPTMGSWGDTGTLPGLIKHISRQEYGTLRLSPMRTSPDDEQGMMERNGEYLFDTVYQIGPLVIPFGIGFFKTVQDIWRRSQDSGGSMLRTYGTVLVLPWIFYLVVFHSLANIPLNRGAMGREVHRRFWMQPHILVSVWIGIGLHSIFRKLMEMTNTASLLQKRITFMSAGLGLFITICLTLVCNQHNMMLIRDQHGKQIVSEFAKLALRDLPSGTILLSHNDLNWNSIRYLQACENIRPDVTHLSLQLMPYPWFKKQQEPLYEKSNVGYPAIMFPEILRNASTERKGMGNQELISRFVLANLELSNPRPIYLDIEAVNFAHIGLGGIYANSKLRLIPRGLLWQVVRDVTTEYPKQQLSNEVGINLNSYQQVETTKQWKQTTASLLQDWKQDTLSNTQEVLTFLHHPKGISMDPGSWEHAAVTIAWDGVYQRGLHLLTSVMELRQILGDSVDSKDASTIFQAAVDGYQTLNKVALISNQSYSSQSVRDVLKNTALAAVKLVECATTIVQIKLKSGSYKTATTKHMLVERAQKDLGQLLLPFRDDIATAVNRFADSFPTDKDSETLRGVLRLPLFEQTSFS